MGRVRAVAGNASTVGSRRAALYSAAAARVKQAIEAGYYLEAITLSESLLTDRLESRATFLAGEDRGFLTLGPLIRVLRQLENVAEFKKMLEPLDAWRLRRNSALHEMVKFEPHDVTTWEQRLEVLPSVAAEGMRLFRLFDRLDRAGRRPRPRAP